MVYTLRFFPLQNAVCFIILTDLVPVLFTFNIHNVLKFKNNSCAKRLIIIVKEGTLYEVNGCRSFQLRTWIVKSVQ